MNTVCFPFIWIFYFLHQQLIIFNMYIIYQNISYFYTIVNTTLFKFQFLIVYVTLQKHNECLYIHFESYDFLKFTYQSQQLFYTFFGIVCLLIANRDRFLSFFSIYIYFIYLSCLTVLASPSRTVSDRSNKDGHPSLLPILQEHSVFHHYVSYRCPLLKR